MKDIQLIPNRMYCSSRSATILQLSPKPRPLSYSGSANIQAVIDESVAEF